MQTMIAIANMAKGYRTYCTALASFLAFLVPLTGLVDQTHGQAVGMALLAVSAIFHRMATADVDQGVSVLTDHVQKSLPPQSPPVDPASNPTLITS